MTTEATRQLLDRLLEERTRQDEKWGVQNHPMHYAGSQRDAEHYRKEAEFWKKLNEYRVQRRTEQGVPADRRCAWDGIILEEICEGLAEERPGLQFTELLQATAVGLVMIDMIDRQAREETGHAIWCPTLDVDGILTAPELCTCKENT
jgi:hypothetical protein